MIAIPPDWIAEVDVVVASRLHGTPLSQLNAKPVVPVSFDRKVDWQIEDVGQGEHVLDIAKFPEEDLIHVFDCVLECSTEMQYILRDHVDRYQTPLHIHYQLLAIIVRRSCSSRQSMASL